MNITNPDHGRCQEFLERLSMYLDNDLNPLDRQAIEQHLRDCPCCEEVLGGLKQTVNLCHDEGQPELPAEIRDRARARVASLLAQPPRRRAKRG
ncbi:MAG TPA: zf-HC2 domain-containing protein [Vicinamibacterales bacterium]|jgi:anti-sigma factor RsiW